MRKKKLNNNQREAQEAIDLMQRFLDEDGGDAECGAIVVAGKIAKAGAMLLHNEDGPKFVAESFPLCLKMNDWLAAQNVGMAVAFFAASGLADKIVEDIEDVIANQAEPAKDAAASTDQVQQQAQQDSKAEQKLKEVLALVQSTAHSTSEADVLRNNMANVVKVITNFLWQKQPA